MNILIPRMSEKSYALSMLTNTYVFDVDLNTNRTEVARAITSLYGVEVKDVRIAVIKGKAVRHIRKGGRVNTGTRATIKKAYVTIVKGQTLPVFASTETENADDKKSGKKAEAKEAVVIEKRRGLFSRKDSKATGAANASVKVARTQAKVGEK